MRDNLKPPIDNLSINNVYDRFLFCCLETNRHTGNVLLGQRHIILKTVICRQRNGCQTASKFVKNISQAIIIFLLEKHFLAIFVAWSIYFGRNTIWTKAWVVTGHTSVVYYTYCWSGWIRDIKLQFSLTINRNKSQLHHLL